MDMTLTRSDSSSTLPMAEAFFASAITSGSLAHAYILKGKAIAQLYLLALNIAKVLNCFERQKLSETQSTLGTLACGHCKNCRWIQENAHPAVLTISRFTYQVQDKRERPELLSADELEKLAQKSSWPTLIKTDQMAHLIHQLGISSDAVRVVIFTDGEELPASYPSQVPAPSEWRSLEATRDRTFHIRPLQRHLFNAASVNRFLKTLEEPPPRTVFFFIAETEEQLLETIVSRCQVVPCISQEPDKSHQQISPDYEAFLSAFLERLSQQADMYLLTAEFTGFFLQGQGLTLAQALETLQLYLRQRFLRENASLNSLTFDQYQARQCHLNQALRMLSAKTNENQVLLNLMLSLQLVS